MKTGVFFQRALHFLKLTYKNNLDLAIYNNGVLNNCVFAMTMPEYPRNDMYCVQLLSLFRKKVWN